MTIFGREPAFWIGVIAACILAVVQTLLGQGVVSDALAGQATDFVTALSQVVTLLVPVIAGLLIRTQVTPTAAPQLDKGTTVEVITPAGMPNEVATL